MNLDIHTAVITALILTLLGVLLSVWSGIQAISAGRRTPFFRIRQKQVASGWRLIGLAMLLAVFAVILARYAEPAADRIYPPTPTASRTPTMALTATITLTSTIT